jgi:hypothetical protein
MTLTRDAILAATNGEVQRISVPEFGGDVYIRVLTGRERDTLERFILLHRENPATAMLRARLCATTVCDETGKRIFTDADIPALAEKSGTALERIAVAILRHNLIGTEDTDANFPLAPSDIGGSG